LQKLAIGSPLNFIPNALPQPGLTTLRFQFSLQEG
jgi:hypothetical protein